MRCQVIYLWITCLEQPPCAECIFLFSAKSSLESCRSVIADATLCHPEFALTSCVPSGRAISILACPRVCWRWEWLIKQVWASTPILPHAKQELHAGKNEDGNTAKHITINLCTRLGPSQGDNYLSLQHALSLSHVHLRWNFQVFITTIERPGLHWQLHVNPVDEGGELFPVCFICGKVLRNQSCSEDLFRLHLVRITYSGCWRASARVSLRYCSPKDQKKDEFTVWFSYFNIAG